MRFWKVAVLLSAFCSLPLLSGCGSSTISEEAALEQEKADAQSSGDNVDDGGGPKRREREEAQ